MEKQLQLSVLDQSPVRKGGTAVQALRETVELAQMADQLGYTRYWVSEHHNIKSLAGSAPEVLIAHLIGATSTIRIGSGGVMLPNHSALKVAENFRLLEALAPGRIDLGIGRAPGGDRATSALLNPTNTFNESDFIRQIEELQDFLTDTSSNGNARMQVRATPFVDSEPALWMLTSSGHSGLVAAHFGMGLSFAHFINPIGGPEMMRAYRKAFQPSWQWNEPQASIGVFVLCADTDAKAQELQATMDWQLLNIERGIREGFPSYEEIKHFPYSDNDRERIRYNRSRTISGTPEQVKAKLLDLSFEYQVNEVVIATITYDFADRRRSYELLAEVFGLPNIPAQRPLKVPLP